jgi:protease-4
MVRLVGSLVLAAAVSLLSGCVTINALGSGRKDLVETVVYGTTGPKVLLLDIDDVITDIDISGPLGVGRQESTVARVREQLDRAKKAKVAGVLIRINSPGGGVTASDVVYGEVMRFKTESQVPVVTMMMGVAASGGYYVAMASDYILAHPTTVTGSIGVIASGLNLHGLMDRYGVTDQTITAGAFKDAGSPFRPMKPEERAYLQAIVDDMHERFRNVVEDGRPDLGHQKVMELSDGRVYTATQAEELGLIDAVGYMPDAIDELKRRIQAPELRVVSFHRDREWRANLYSASSRPPPEAGVSERLGLDRRPGFLYLWWPGLAP